MHLRFEASRGFSAQPRFTLLSPICNVFRSLCFRRYSLTLSYDQKSFSAPTNSSFTKLYTSQGNCPVYGALDLTWKVRTRVRSCKLKISRHTSSKQRWFPYGPVFESGFSPTGHKWTWYSIPNRVTFQSKFASTGHIFSFTHIYFSFYIQFFGLFVYNFWAYFLRSIFILRWGAIFCLSSPHIPFHFFSKHDGYIN